MIFGSVPWMFVFRTLLRQAPPYPGETNAVYLQRWRGKYMGWGYFLKSFVAVLLEICVFLPGAFLFYGSTPAGHDPTIVTICWALPLVLIPVVNWICYHLLRPAKETDQNPWVKRENIIFFVVGAAGVIQLIIYLTILLPDIVNPNWTRDTDGITILPWVAFLGSAILASAIGLYVHRARPQTVSTELIPVDAEQPDEPDEPDTEEAK